MLTIREIKKAATLEEAWQLNQKRPNRVMGGMLCQIALWEACSGCVYPRVMWLP